MPSFECFHLVISHVGEIVVITLDIGKTLNSIDLVNLMSSVSVRFNSFLFLYSIFNEHKSQQHFIPLGICTVFPIGVAPNFRPLLSPLRAPTLSAGRSGWTRTIDLTLIRRAL